MGKAIVVINGKRFDGKMVGYMADCQRPYQPLPQIEEISFNVEIPNDAGFLIHEVTTEDGSTEVFACPTDGRPETEVLQDLQSLASRYGCSTKQLTTCPTILDVMAWAEANGRRIKTDIK